MSLPSPLSSSPLVPLSSPWLPSRSSRATGIVARAACLAALGGLLAGPPACAQSVAPPPRTLVPLHDSAASKPAPLSLLAATAPAAGASSAESTLPPIPGAPSASARLPIGLGDTIELRIDADQSLGGPARPALQAREDVLKLPGGPRLVVSPAVGLARAPDGHFFASGLFAVTMDQSLSSDARAFVQVRGDRFSLVREDTPEMTLAAGVGWTPRRSVSVDLSMAQGITPGTTPLQGRGAIRLRF